MGDLRYDLNTWNVRTTLCGGIEVEGIGWKECLKKRRSDGDIKDVTILV